MTEIWVPEGHPEFYRGKQGARYVEPTTTSYTSVPVCQFLIGRPWDDIALAYVGAMRPSMIRVTDGWVTCDSITHRVTVTLGADRLIESVTQEVEVGLPDGVENGFELDRALERTSPKPAMPEPSHYETHQS